MPKHKVNVIDETNNIENLVSKLENANEELKNIVNKNND